MTDLPSKGIDHSDRLKLIRIYLKRGDTNREIARWMGVSIEQVKRWLVEIGLGKEKRVG